MPAGHEKPDALISLLRELDAASDDGGLSERLQVATGLLDELVKPSFAEEDFLARRVGS
jgi:hypothetical protein